MGGVKTISIIVAANIKGLETGLGQANKSIGRFASQAARVGSLLSFGVTAPLTALGKQAFNTFSEFENSMTKVAAVTGATADEFSILTGEAKRLGSTTQFTAKQVSDLQLVLGRKGFDPAAIEDMTGSILDLSLATGEDLSLAAEVVAANINAFNLEADDAASIANTLASAASESSIQLDTFATAFGHAGASANAVGVSIEDLSAMMGVLMDNGIKASKAGTGLRKIFMKLNETGTKFSDVIAEAAEQEMTLNRAQELVGTTAANQLLVLTDNLEKVNELSDAYETNTGRLKEMADLMGQTTFAKVKKLESAFEGFKLEVGEVLSEMLMPMIETVTSLFGAFGTLDKDTQKLIVTFGGIALAAGPVLLLLAGLAALATPLATGFGIVVGILEAIGAALAFIGVDVLAGSAIFAAIASLGDTLGDEARIKERVKDQHDFMTETYAAHKALEEEYKSFKKLMDEMDRMEAFQREKDLDSGVTNKEGMTFSGMPSLSPIKPGQIPNAAGGSLTNTIGEMTQQINDFEENLNEKIQKTRETLTGFAVNVASSFADSFASMAVSGELTLESLGNLFKDLLKMMAQMVIKALIMTAILSALGIAPTGAVGAGGQGLSAFQNTMLGMMGGSFANGGQPPLGKLSLVGEQGPELFVPQQKGSIVPNGQFGGSVIPDVRISGEDLLIVFDRATKHRNALG